MEQQSDVWNKWYTPIKTGEVTGDLIDFHTEIIYQYNEETQKSEPISSIRLYFFTNHKKYVTVLHKFDPYFYVDYKPQYLKKLLKAIRFMHQQDIIKAKSTELVLANPLSSKTPISSEKKMLKIKLYTPVDVKKLCDYLENNYSQYFYGFRENKIRYHHRVANDENYKIGNNYTLKVDDYYVLGKTENPQKKLPKFPTFIYDIEIRKEPVKAPKPTDPIDYISVVLTDINEKKQGFLLTNHELTYIPMNSFYIGVQNKHVKAIEGKYDKNYPILKFNIISCKNEKELLFKFQQLFLECKPLYFGGYYSDNFDMKHIIERSKRHSVNWDHLLEFDSYRKIYHRPGCFTGDLYHWVKTKSYLSKGMQKLKTAFTKIFNLKSLETDHEQQVREWQLIKECLLDPKKYMQQNQVSWKDLSEKIHKTLKKSNVDLDLLDSPDLTLSEKTNTIAKKLIYRFGHYCAADSYITSMLADKIVINFNLGLCKKVSFNGFEIERSPNGEIVTHVLLNRMKNQYILPEPKDKLKDTYLYLPPNATVLKTKKNEKIKADRYTYTELQALCKNCPEKSCKKTTEKMWRSPNQSWNICLCKKLTRKEKKNKYIFPRSSQDKDNLVFVKKDNYEGGLVKCNQPGFFKTGIDYEINVDLDRIYDIKKMFLKIAKKWIQNHLSFEIVKYNMPIQAKLLNHISILKTIEASFDSFISQIKNNKWKGKIILIHVDVASMYPSIIIHYNLQPYSVVEPDNCKECPYHWKKQKDRNPCWVEITWNRKIKAYNINHDYIEDIVKELQGKPSEKVMKKYAKLSKKNRQTAHVTYNYPVVSRFCQKTDRFYSMSVEDFRNERYFHKYKAIELEGEVEKLKLHHKNESEIQNLKEEQIFHLSSEKGLKVPLNTFYGYPYGRGSNFLSLPFVGAITSVGRDIITFALDFLDPISDNIEFDTDGVWNMFPEILPLIIPYEYTYYDPIKKKEIIEKKEFKIINEVINDVIKEKFQNQNNYVPCNQNSEIKNKVNEPWDITQDQSQLQNQRIKYEYQNVWKQDPKWKNIPKNKIMFDLDGPYSMIFVYTEKRMKVYSRQNGTSKVEVITGLDEIRNDSIGISRMISEIVTGTCVDLPVKSLQEIYELTAKELNKKILEPLAEKTFTKDFTLDLIIDSSGISENTLKSVDSAFKQIAPLFSQLNDCCLVSSEIEKYKEDILSKNSLKMSSHHIDDKKEDTQNDDLLIKKYDLILNALKTVKRTYAMTALRSKFIQGFDVDLETNLSWIILTPQITLRKKDPDTNKWEQKTYDLSDSISERVFPTIIFEMDTKKMQDFLHIVYGFEKNFLEDLKIEDLIDWDYYYSRAYDVIETYFINPGIAQGVDPRKYLKLKKKDKPTKRLSLTDFY